MQQYIVITSINQATESVREFSKLMDYKVIVVGDKKTPSDWYCENVDYLSISRQREIGTSLYKVLPYNHYCRKMMGYLYCIENQAQVIIDTDDDNIPKPGWKFPAFDGEFLQTSEGNGFINIYEYYTDMKIWPRGLPLDKINSKYDFSENQLKKGLKVGIWQGLADEDPDVDAIYRLTNNQSCYFKEQGPIVLGKGTVSPSNSQNTAYIKELFPLLYLPTFVTFRFTDILRGIIAQPIMWLYNYHLGYTDATVVQKRNPHDYFQDFISEIPMYKFGESVFEITCNTISKNFTLVENLYRVYDELSRQEIVKSEEMNVLTAWLCDIEKAGNS